MTLLADHDVTEEWKGPEEIVQKSLAIMYKIRSNFDLCTDSSGPKTVLGPDQIKEAYVDLKRRGVKIRMITEITNDNLAESKEFMKMAEVQHLEGILGNFVIADATDYAGAPETVDGILLKLMVSNVSAFVKQQQYFFETLWAKAIPAEQRIKEIEVGILPPITETVYGAEKVIQVTLNLLSMAKTSLDMCGDSKGPGFILRATPVHQKFIELKSRGVRIRMIVEINKENINDGKKMIEFADVRHLEGIKGYSTILDSRVFASNTAGDGPFIPHVVYSTVEALVEQQQYFFETLWSKSIPSDKKIREIEEGKEPERLEVIQDTQKSISRAFEIMNGTKNEFLVLFASAHAFSLAATMEAAKFYGEMLTRGANVRVLVPMGHGIQNVITMVKNTAPGIDIRISDTELNTRITIMVSDRKHFMSWQLRDDNLQDPYQVAGVATYSNIASLAESYATIFENLWKITEFAENLKIANMKLESSERSMKDFIDVAAHELRTPIQPIIGLSEVLRDKTADADQLEMFNVIIRNAERLQRLQEDILDVTRIESQLIKFDKQMFDIDEVISQVARDVEKSSTSSDTPEILTDLDSNSTVKGDKQRIVQVVLNLIGNSLKFTKNGTINIRSRRQDGEVLVSVIDTGMGIDPEIMPKLFMKFVTRSPTGTGLGLFISKSIIEGHGGKIWAENNVGGKGATFTFTLPLVN